MLFHNIECYLLDKAIVSVMAKTQRTWYIVGADEYQVPPRNVVTMAFSEAH